MIAVPKRIDLFKLLPAGAIGAEVGVWKGYFSIEVLNNTDVKKLYLVDAWKSQPGYNDPLSDTDHEANLLETKHHLRGHPTRWEIVRGNSTDVAAHWKGPQLDFGYIDADHSYEACLADLEAWQRIIKPGGCLMGHDYTDCEQAKRWKFGVINAVADFCIRHSWKITHVTQEEFASYRLERNAQRS